MLFRPASASMGLKVIRIIGHVSMPYALFNFRLDAQ